MSDSIIEQSTEIFGTLEKWQALYEMEQAVPKILTHWLTNGAKAMRTEFLRTSNIWACSTWGVERDTRWYLSDLGQESISLGIGWETFELHLFDGRNDGTTWKTATELLGHLEFQGLKERIIHRRYRPYSHSDKILLSDLQFDPFASGFDGNFRHRYIAWMAAHETDEFVNATLERIHALLDDEEFVRLVRELTKRSA